MPESKILLLCDQSVEKEFLETIVTGINGYVLETWSLNELFSGLQYLQKEGVLFPRVLTKKLVSEIREKIPSHKSEQNLTKKEIQILKFLAEGKTNKEIARAITSCEKTVKNHLYSIFQKLGVKNRVEAVTVALSSGIISVDQNYQKS